MSRFAITADTIAAADGAAGLAMSALLGVAAASAETKSPRSAIAIVGASVYPAADAAPIDDAVILIKGGAIEAVGPRRSTNVPSGYRIIDQSGKFVTAGFWNSHVHLTTPVLIRSKASSNEALEQELERDFTRWGFTTVFDLASTTEIATDVRERVADGRVNGPRVLSVGEPFYPNGATPVYARPFYEAFNLPSAEINCDRSAQPRVRRQVRQGARGIKLFTGAIVGEQAVVHMSAKSVAAISRTARGLGVPVFAHPTDKQGLELAVRNGATILAHSAALMGPWSPEYARWIAKPRVALIPTLALFEVQPHPSTPVGVAVQQVAALHRVGGVILFGTDAGFTDAFDTTADLRLLNDAIGWRGVLQSLTTAPAETLGESLIRGRVAAGFAADLVVLGGDPADDVANFADVRMVVRDGRLIYSR